VARPTYEELVAENGRLQARVQQLQGQVDELTLLVEKLRREGKRQAAPFRKQDEPLAKPKSRAASRAGGMGRMPIASCRHASMKPTTCR